MKLFPERPMPCLSGFGGDIPNDEQRQPLGKMNLQPIHGRQPPPPTVGLARALNRIGYFPLTARPDILEAQGLA
jgi:hypothetical protein